MVVRGVGGAGAWGQGQETPLQLANHCITKVWGEAGQSKVRSVVVVVRNARAGA